MDFPKRKPNICNFLDQAYAAAKSIQGNSAGTLTGSQYCIHPANGDSDPNCDTCFGIPVYQDGDTGARPTSCSTWNLRNMVTTFRQYGGFCGDNEYSGLLGAGFQDPRIGGESNMNTINKRQTFTQCFETSSCTDSGFWGNPPQEISKTSALYNLFNMFHHYGNSDNPWIGD